MTISVEWCFNLEKAPCVHGKEEYSLKVWYVKNLLKKTVVYDDKLQQLH